MDAGLAAVLGALAGSTATIGAALATGWAQREGARITARSEHRRQRLEPRTVIYREFIRHATDLRAVVIGFKVDASAIRLDQIDDEIARRVRSAADGVREIWPDVVLAGPESIFEAAAEVYGSALSVSLAMQDAKNYGSDGRVVSEGRQTAIRLAISRSAKRMWQSVDEFVLVAQEALDDDGSLN